METAVLVSPAFSLKETNSSDMHVPCRTSVQIETTLTAMEKNKAESNKGDCTPKDFCTEGLGG